MPRSKKSNWKWFENYGNTRIWKVLAAKGKTNIVKFVNWKRNEKHSVYVWMFIFRAHFFHFFSVNIILTSELLLLLLFTLLMKVRRWMRVLCNTAGFLTDVKKLERIKNAEHWRRNVFEYLYRFKWCRNKICWLKFKIFWCAIRLAFLFPHEDWVQIGEKNMKISKNIFF